MFVKTFFYFLGNMVWVKGETHLLLVFTRSFRSSELKLCHLSNIFDDSKKLYFCNFSSLDLKDCVNTRSRCVSLLPSPFTLTMFPNFLIPQFPVDGLDWNSFNMFEGWFWTYGNAIYVLVSIKLRFFQTIFYLFTNQTMCSHFCFAKITFQI